MINFNETVEARKQRVEVSGKFISQQFQSAIEGNVRTLQNLASRIENSNGDYFSSWKFDAGLIIDQHPSISFIEWIDSTMVIRDVTPLESNRDAIGLDIGQLEYRRADWIDARMDSSVNVTHWLELVQGRYAFLVDVPVYYDAAFQGTITAGMNFESQFDQIMLGREIFHVEVIDDKGTVFYEYGDHEGTQAYLEYMYESTLSVSASYYTYWTFRIIPNSSFITGQGFFNKLLNLALALVLCVLLSVALYYVQKSSRSQKRYKEAIFKLRALIDSSPIAVYVTDNTGVVVDFWNKAAEDMLGWKREEVIGGFLPHVEEYREEFETLRQSVMRGNQIKDKELVRKRKDGSEIIMRVNVGHLLLSDGKVNQMIVLAEDITEEKETQQQLENSLKEKEVLLKEVHHRVKNNLAIITGLIELQIEDVDDADLKNILKETQNRIFSIAGVHELLYNTLSFTDISVEEYVQKLIQRMSLMFEGVNAEIEIVQKMDLQYLNINQAIPLGLMLNELITNSYKHAFTGKEQGKIEIIIQEVEERITVTYRDNGTGFDLNKFNSSNTLGLLIIKTLLDQLDAEYEVNAEGGFELDFYFNLLEKGSHSNL